MATLEVVEGSEKGRRFALTESLMSFGRDDTCTFQLLDPKVSRTHLQIQFKGGRHLAADYRTTNGVFVNDVAVLSPVALSTGDRVRIGDTVLVYRAEDLGDTSARPGHGPAKSKGQWGEETLERKG